ncbi:MAG: hypothetical protein ABWW65_01585 [Thermoprotei archaeon]
MSEFGAGVVFAALAFAVIIGIGVFAFVVFPNTQINLEMKPLSLSSYAMYGLPNYVLESNMFKLDDTCVWSIVITIVNKGSGEESITDVFVNGKTPEDAKVMAILARDSAGNSHELPVTLKPGEKVTIIIILNGEEYSWGQLVKVTLITGTGYTYTTLVTLS